MRLQGMTAVVAGSSSGNGRAIATTFAAEGASVICADLRRDPLPGNYDQDATLTTDEVIGKAGGEAKYIQTFLASKDAAWITGAILPVDGGYTAQ
jgi:NAD(P)-dependent dehydrogenase (short-subunit alcohol dehydrogenase family)